MARDNGRESGTVKWFNRVKGWGFIIPDEGGEELFVHYEHIKARADEKYVNLHEGERVSYERVEREKGPMATRVRVTGGGA